MNGSTNFLKDLDNAFTVKMTTADLKSDADEIAVEAIEISFEELTISNG
ncbi:hypothetical protein [Cyclobacterium sp.]|nr:hypothetical protein [Cyclobacterium sp.]MBD3628180.1 hypothetical protein [Cyclobacterium sp.]